MKQLITTLFLGVCVSPVMAQWNNNTSVNLEVSTRSVSDMKAVNTVDGKTWVAYYSQRPQASRYDMYAQLLDTAGNKLLGPDGVAVDTNMSGSATFVYNVCVDGKGDLIIGMQDQRTGSGMTTVGYKVDQTGGNAWNNGNGVVLGSGYSPYVTALKSGDVVFAWLENSGKITFQKYASNGTALWAAPKALIQNSRRAQLSPMSDSGFVMVYQQPAGVINSKPYAQRFNKDGDSVWTSSVQLSTEATSSARYYSITNDKDTTYFGYYTSSAQNHFNAWVHRINPDGTLPYGGSGAAVSDYAANSDPGEQTTNIALQPNSPYVWAATSFSVTSPQMQWGVMVQKFDKATGQRLLNANGKVVYPLSTDQYAQQGNLTFKRQYPVFMVVSAASYLIKGTVLNEDGDFLLPAQDFELSSTTATLADPKGRFSFTDMVRNQSVAVWSENRGPGLRAYAQNFRLDMLDTSVAVATVNSVPAVINTFQGTLAMTSAVLPATASQDVTWSVVPGTGAATISTAGVVTAVANGTVWAKATSTISPVYADSMQINISNQDTATAIADVESNIGFHMYPNPANDVLNILISAQHTALVMDIVDISGRVMMTQKIAANALNQPQSFNLKHLAAGTYVLELRGEGLKVNKKFSKQ